MHIILEVIQEGSLAFLFMGGVYLVSKMENINNEKDTLL